MGAAIALEEASSVSSSSEPAPLVAIIDDDIAMRLSLIDLMKSAGYSAAGFASAEEFLLSGKWTISRCIVTDIQMPGLDGFDLKRALDEANSSVPVIMITARVDQYSERQVRECGAFCFLRKPFLAADLLTCVERSLRR